jgi:O-glycosyl hydrolase
LPRPASATGVAVRVRAGPGHLTRAGARGSLSHRGVLVHVVQTTASLSQRMTRLPDIWMEPRPARTVMVVRVRDDVRYQTILGFGAGLTDSSAWLIRHELSRSARDELMREVFSSDGIELNYLRLPIGASDFSVGGTPFSYDEMPPGESDPDVRHFSLAHDLSYIIPTLRQARAVDPRIFIIANPWTAPSWMKTNQRFDNFDNTGTLLPSDYGSYATYFVRFLQGYRRHGVTVDAVTPQNEPGVANAPSMNLSQPDEATFVTQYLRPALLSASLPTQVYGLDASWDMAWPYAFGLVTGPARRELNGIAWHCYYESPTAMAQLHALAPELLQLVNECSPEVRPFSTAEALIGSLRNWASGFALWNLALDRSGGPALPPDTWCGGCQGLVTVDESNHSIDIRPKYYQLGQVSKFVARGAVHVYSNTFVIDQTNEQHIYEPTTGLDDVAFVNPSGEHVLVTYNNSTMFIRFALSWHKRAVVYSQPPAAMTTFTWR